MTTKDLPTLRISAGAVQVTPEGDRSHLSVWRNDLAIRLLLLRAVDPSAIDHPPAQMAKFVGAPHVFAFERNARGFDERYEAMVPRSLVVATRQFRDQLRRARSRVSDLPRAIEGSPVVELPADFVRHGWHRGLSVDAIRLLLILRIEQHTLKLEQHERGGPKDAIWIPLPHSVRKPRYRLTDQYASATDELVAHGIAELGDRFDAKERRPPPFDFGQVRYFRLKPRPFRRIPDRELALAHLLRAPQRETAASKTSVL